MILISQFFSENVLKNQAAHTFFIDEIQQEYDTYRNENS